MTINRSGRVRAAEGTLFRELQGEAVLLNLGSESYFGLDAVGTRMWMLLTAAESIQAAYETLLDEYDVEPEKLREDLDGLIGKLVEHGLVKVADG
jgi:hypothetical protein